MNGGAGGDRWLKLMEGKPIKKDCFKRMKGSEVTLEWLDSDEGALKEPIVVESPDGLGMKMPPSNFSVNDVAETLGQDHPVSVIGELSTTSIQLSSIHL
jgi:hypothetical protein